MPSNRARRTRGKMFPPAHPLLEYRAARTYNREVAMLKLPGMFHAFTTMDETAERVSLILTEHRDRNGKTHVSLINFMLLLQRQARTAFDAFVEGQAYQGWLLFRPGLEAALIIGKWLDDPNNATIWKNRRNDWKSYKQEYEGKALRSASLPGSDQLQSVLKRINDDFVHPNPDYVGRHIKVTKAGAKASNLWLMYFDDEPTVQVQLLAFLHLHLSVIDSLLTAYKKLFSGIDLMQSGLAEFETAFGPRVLELRKMLKNDARPLKDFGLWQ